MKVHTLLKIAAVELAAIGAISLVAPQAGSSGLGVPLSPFDTFVARSLGVLLLTLAAVNWTVGRERGRPLLRAIASVNIFMNVALGTIDILAILDGTIGPGGWPGIVIHIAFAAGFLYLIVPARLTFAVGAGALDADADA